MGNQAAFGGEEDATRVQSAGPGRALSQWPGAPELPPPSGRADSLPPPQAGRLRTPCVLLVTENPQCEATITSALERDFAVLVAPEPDLAMQQCVDRAIDLVLVDGDHPDEFGVSWCRTMQADEELRHLPTILISSGNSPEDETCSLRAGAVDFITQPVNPSVLRARVRTHLTLKRQADLLRELAYFDALTGLANRRRFDSQLDLEWRACLRDDTPLGLIALDVDYFKQYNDHYGHPAGDEVLRSLAQVFDSALRRPRDFIARVGGEEFVCLLPGSDLEMTARSADYLLSHVRDASLAHCASPIAPYITLSAGAASTVPSPRESAMDLLGLADRRLYHAKMSGRGRLSAGSDSAGAMSGLQLVSPA